MCNGDSDGGCVDNEEDYADTVTLCIVSWGMMDGEECDHGGVNVNECSDHRNVNANNEV